MIERESKKERVDWSQRASGIVLLVVGVNVAQTNLAAGLIAVVAGYWLICERIPRNPSGLSLRVEDLLRG